MRLFLIILSGVLYFSNTKICLWLYPYDFADKSTHHLYDGFLMAKYTMYQTLILILLVLLSVTELKRKGTRWYLFVAYLVLSIFVSVNIIDISQGITTYHFHDIVVVFMAFVLSRGIYLKYKKRENT